MCCQHHHTKSKFQLLGIKWILSQLKPGHLVLAARVVKQQAGMNLETMVSSWWLLLCGTNKCMPINISALSAFLQRACCISSLGEEGTRLWGMSKPCQSVALAACLLSLQPAEREGQCCWTMASRSHCGAFDMSASACGKLHLPVYSMWCLKTDWHWEPGRAPARLLTARERQQQLCVCQRLEIKTSFYLKHQSRVWNVHISFPGDIAHPGWHRDCRVV